MDLHEAAPDVPALGALQKRTAQAIVNIFETGTVLGKYGQVTVLEHDTGHLTFGRSQTTLSTGNLAHLVSAYCDTAGARFGKRLAPFLDALRAHDISLDKNQKLHNVLRATADDPVMRAVQDAFFDSTYWKPALGEAAALHIDTPLGIATVYDSVVHGSWALMRDRTNQSAGKIAQLGEQAWITAYIATRRHWLANHPRPDLRPTVYRMNALGALAAHGNWSLQLPMLVRDEEISLASLDAAPPDCYNGPAPGSRSLAVATPFHRGLDVRLVQLGLSDADLEVKADGVFGPGTSRAVKAFQLAQGLAPTGAADIALIGRLTA